MGELVQVTDDGLRVWRSTNGRHSAALRQNERVDIDPARAYLIELSKAGIGYKRVAALTGLAVSAVGRVKFGDAITARRDTVEKILAFRPDGLKVYPDQSRRRRTPHAYIHSESQPRTGEGSVFEAILHLLDQADQPWRARAACRDPKIDQEIFFPRNRGRNDHAHEARLVCARCPVKAECLEVGHREQYGIWGGKTPKERRAMRMGAAQ